MSKSGQSKLSHSAASIVPIAVASITSVAWVLLAVYLGLHAADDKRIWPLTNLSANEWGDFLAGVAGTLAFIWLIATVFIQSKELRLQRAEMEDNREVASEQARYIAEQTILLQQESAERRNSLILQSINAVTDRIVNILTSRNFRGLAVNIDMNGPDLFPITGFDKVSLVHQVRMTYQRYRVASWGFYARGSSFNEGHFIELFHEVRDWAKLSRELDLSYSRLRKDAAEIEMLIEIVDAILKVDTNLKHSIGEDP